MNTTSRAEALTRSFYDWERCGRGWQEWPWRVALEPPLQPVSRIRESLDSFTDDARTSHWLVRLYQHLTRSQADGVASKPTHEALVAPPFVAALQWRERELLVPANAHTDGPSAAVWLRTLAACGGPLAFELVGGNNRVSVRLANTTADDALIAGSLQACFPNVVLTEPAGTLAALWSETKGGAVSSLEFGLGREFMLPLRSDQRAPDPLAAFIAALATVAPDELAVLQVLFQEVEQPWAQAIRQATTTSAGKPFFADAPGLTKQAAEKTDGSLHAVALRIATKTRDEERGWTLIRQLASGLGQFATPQGNELVPLGAEGADELIEDILARTTHRSGMIWSAEEVAALVHPPSASIRCEGLARQIKKTKAVPVIATAHDFVLGENLHAGKRTTVTLSTTQRLRHTYLIGASGTGKSTLLLHMILQDLERGAGIAVLDPHGDLIDQVLKGVPASRQNDVVVFDAGDEECPIGLNFLTARSAAEKNLLASDLVAVFRRLSTSWGDQMTSVLGNAITAFLESREGGTIGDLRRFLVEPDFRRHFLETVSDPEIVYFWQREFPLLTGRPQAPILTRLDTFLRPKLVRHIVCQKESRLDLGAVMDEGKVVLAKLAQGAIGEENAYLLGSLLVSRFHQHALRRQEQAEADRRPFFLYIDECHHFVTPSMASILSGARKYRLGLVLANQELRQLGSRDSDMLQAVLANPCTRICFRVGDDDARKLADGFSTFDPTDLLNLGVGEAICRVEQASQDFNLQTRPLPESDPQAAANRKSIVEQSQAKYGRPPSAPVESPLPPLEPVPGNRETAAADQARDAAAEPVPTPAVAIAPPTVPTPKPRATPGRGGSQHKYLQELIARWAEQRGLKASIEQSILDGLGSVDVAIQKGELKIGCEITVTTSPSHELGNVQKCLAAGFDAVAVVSANKKTLEKARAFVTSTLDQPLIPRVHFFSPEELFGYLEALGSATDEVHETSQGYRVRVKYQAAPDAAAQAKRAAIGNILLKSLRRMKGEQNGPGPNHK